MKQQGRHAARAECVIRKCYFELAWMEQSQAGINAHNLLKNSVIYPLGIGFSLPQPISDCVSCFVMHNVG